MRIRLDPTAPVPPFEQIRAQIALAVTAGRLEAGDRLPTIRSLSTELDVSPNTIARAYRELIDSGIVVARGRQGTFISDAPPNAHPIAHRNELLADAADRYADRALELAVSTEDAVEALIHALRRSRLEPH